jgi:hypothetical protein
MTIINQKRTSDWINTFLKQFEYGGMLPVWELSANETFCMIGYHSVPVIVDAWKKGIRSFDASLALKAMRSYAESDRFGLNHYRENGYLGNELEHESVSKTLEYAYDDWCIAQMAKSLDNDSVYRTYIQRAQYYKNLFDPASMHMRGKIQSAWHYPFDPREINNFFTEGNSWQYSFAVPQDIKHLVQLYGGKKAFAERLNELFTTSSQTTGREQADVTGLIGQYAHGNEPSHHMAYLFNYIGMPFRTQEMVHKICHEFYTNAPAGLIGNEDCGQMSAWYVFSAMGFYPVNPASGEYVLGTPLFDEVKLHLENGKTFFIKAKRNSPGSKYVRSTKINDHQITRSYIQHEEIMKGGSLEFILQDIPDKKWAASENDLPHSSIEDEQIVAVPYFELPTNKFNKELQVAIKNIDSQAEIFYRLVKPEIRTAFVKYENPFSISETCDVQAYALKKGKQSKIADQHFHKISNDYTIRVISKVHPMYTAGGPEALIDGLMGTENWKTGEWQSYFDQDFEAIVDLKKMKEIKFVGVHMLQDVSPWILFPKEVIFLTSEDGINFLEKGRVKNSQPVGMKPAETKTFGVEVNAEARFIKIKARSGGRLPDWHESAGNPSHLFIDEIIVK